VETPLSLKHFLSLSIYKFEFLFQVQIKINFFLFCIIVGSFFLHITKILCVSFSHFFRFFSLFSPFQTPFFYPQRFEVRKKISHIPTFDHFSLSILIQ
jgi:hypothetical protein